MYFRKRPVIVEAHQWFPTQQEAGKPRKSEPYGVRYIPANKVDLSATRGIIVDRSSRYVIDTQEGVMDVMPGSWIVTGVMGEKYAVRPDIFVMSFEEVSHGTRTKALAIWTHARNSLAALARMLRKTFVRNTV